jgi:hypothetical protein
MYAITVTDHIPGQDTKTETIYEENERDARRTFVDLNLSRFRDTSILGDQIIRICKETDPLALVERLYVFFRTIRPESYTVESKAL